jgi:amino acid transporter
VTLIVAIAMAEICSAYPTSGGLYYWAARLGGNQRVFASWITGWFNLLGQVAITAGVGMACCNSIVALAVMNGSPARANRHGGYSMASYVGGAPNAIGAPGPLAIPEPCPYDGTGALVTAAYQSSWMAANNGSLPMDILGNSFTAGEIAFNVNECNRKPINPTQGQIYAIYIGVMVLAGLLNSFSVRALNGIVTFSILWHILGSVIIIIALPSISRAKWNTKFVWEFWQPNNNAFGTQSLCTKASSAGNPIIFGCPLYGVQTVPPGNTIFQANANGVYVANKAINWGGNGINAQALHMNGKSGNSVNAYIFFCGLLMSQWCYTGYDASAHMSEETKDASTAGPKGIISTIVVTFAFGLAYIVSFIVSIVDFNNTTGGPFALNYNPAAQIFWDVFETRYGNGRYCCGLWIIPLVAQFLCTVASVTSNSRMLYAFARDDAVPGSKLWHVINDRVQIPVNAVWGMCIAALLIALPVINNVEAFAAVTSIATIGLYISYGAPVFCRLTVGRKEFLPGPFFTGRMSVPIAIAAVCWVMTITIFFVLPNTFPIDMKCVMLARVYPY